jgi:hypothetical protein
MSTIESNLKNQPITSISVPSQSAVPPPLLLPTASPLTPTTSSPLPSPPPPTPYYDDKPIEKFYKKEKQISLEFEQIVKGKKNLFDVKKEVHMHLFPLLSTNISRFV